MVLWNNVFQLFSPACWRVKNSPLERMLSNVGTAWSGLIIFFWVFIHTLFVIFLHWLPLAYRKTKSCKFDPFPSPHPPLRYATRCVQSPLFTTEFLFLSCQVNQTPKPSSSALITMYMAPAPHHLRGEVQDGKSPSSLLFGAISPSSLNLV